MLWVLAEQKRKIKPVGGEGKTLSKKYVIVFFHNSCGRSRILFLYG